MNYIDLFAGASGMSEGFKRSGFNPVAHVEMDPHACETIRTRVSFHYLKSQNRLEKYYSYIRGELGSSQNLHLEIPSSLLESVINETISADTIGQIFDRVDYLSGEQNVGHIDLIIGGPPCQ